MFPASRIVLRRSLMTFQRVVSLSNRQSLSVSNFAARLSSVSTNRIELGKIDELERKFQLFYTCKKCSNRNSHLISKLAYEKGVVIVKCAGCQNNHLIADNLKWFKDDKTNIEDILREKGEQVKKVSIEGSEILELLKDNSQ